MTGQHSPKWFTAHSQHHSLWLVTCVAAHVVVGVALLLPLKVQGDILALALSFAYWHGAHLRSERGWETLPQPDESFNFIHTCANSHTPNMCTAKQLFDSILCLYNYQSQQWFWGMLRKAMPKNCSAGRNHYLLNDKKDKQTHLGLKFVHVFLAVTWADRCFCQTMCTELNLDLNLESGLNKTKSRRLHEVPRAPTWL